MASLKEVHFTHFYETYVQGVTCPDKLNLFETDRYMCDEYLSDDDSDKSEDIRVNIFFADGGCCCSLGPNNTPCSDAASIKAIQDLRDSIQEATNEEKDMFILSHFVQSRLPVYLMTDAEKKKWMYSKYSLFGKDVCRKTFLYALNMGVEKLYSLARQYDVNGALPRIHGNRKRLPHNSYGVDVNLAVRSFIENYAEENAILLPGRIPGVKDTDICFLPSAESKHDIWVKYELCCVKGNTLCVSYTTICKLWHEITPWIIVSKTMTDLCWKWESNYIMILYNCANQTDDKKVKQLEHINIANIERKYYKDQCQSTLATIQKLNVDFFTSRRPCTFVGKMHYSWDYAQQLHYPCDPLQSGPIYFKSTRKCGIFGVCIDAVPLQFNYLIDETVSTGKGANATISYFHHFLENHSVGVTEGLFHADTWTV